MATQRRNLPVGQIVEVFPGLHAVPLPHLDDATTPGRCGTCSRELGYGQAGRRCGAPALVHLYDCR